MTSLTATIEWLRLGADMVGNLFVDQGMIEHLNKVLHRFGLQRNLGDLLSRPPNGPFGRIGPVERRALDCR